MSASIKLSESKEEQSIKYYVNKYYLTIIFIVFLVIILITNFMRYDNKKEALLEEESYFYARISQNFFQYSKTGLDEMNNNGRPFSYNLGFPFVISVLSKITNLPVIFFIKYLSILLGLVILLMLYWILKKLHLDWRIISLSLFFVVLSSTFIYFSSFTSPFLFAVLLSLLSYYFFIMDSKRKSMFSGLFLSLIIFFDAYIAFFTLAFLIIFTVTIRKNKKDIMKIDMIIFLLVLFIYYLFFYIKFGMIDASSLGYIIKSNFGNIFDFSSDIGSIYGLSIFIIILCFFGIGDLWKEKYNNRGYYFALIFFIIISFLYKYALFYLNFYMSFLAAIGLLRLIKTRWESEIVRKSLIGLLIICIIFSTVLYIGKLINYGPESRHEFGAKFIAQRNTDIDIIFTDPRYSYILNYYGIKTYIDGNYLYIKDIDQKLKDYNEILNTENFNRLLELVNKYKITYIVITIDMAKDLDFGKTKNILYNLRNTNRFKRVFANNYLEIWRYERI